MVNRIAASTLPLRRPEVIAAATPPSCASASPAARTWFMDRHRSESGRRTHKLVYVHASVHGQPKMPERLASTSADRICNDLTPGRCASTRSTRSRHQRTEQGDKGRKHSIRIRLRRVDAWAQRHGINYRSNRRNPLCPGLG